MPVRGRDRLRSVAALHDAAHDTGADAAPGDHPPPARGRGLGSGRPLGADPALYTTTATQ